MVESEYGGLQTSISKRIFVQGIVQGVGFRPFIYRLAKEEQLRGFVRNTSQGVDILVAGDNQHVERFLSRLPSELPSLAEIESIDIKLEERQAGDLPEEFQIMRSHTQSKEQVRIPADIAICGDCRGEVLDASDRHYMYPLTNCTNCGPRFTVIRDVPYDRKMTTMEPFPMCSACAQEYGNPIDRRFHAQPTACPNCGPSTMLYDKNGNCLLVGSTGASLQQVLQKTAGLLRSGEIIAIKGLGGFHLACDADNREAVMELRRRKKRPYKPLAVMAKKLESVRQRCCLNEQEQALLIGNKAPIVILDKKHYEDFIQVAPDHSTVGVMVPYTPLHVLLMESGAPEWIVMTSANYSNMPIVTDNQEALEGLCDVVDYVLLHDRDIQQSCDDSLVRVQDGIPTVIRRSRGYVPEAIKVPFQAKHTVFAVGGEMKNVFAFAKADEVVLSQHIGEIDSLEGRRNFLHVIGHFQRLFDWESEVIACDKHPSYQVSEIARFLQSDVKFEVQHHHAHMASCMAEHHLQGKTLGIILDGTGFGDDGTLWGTEFLIGDYVSYERVAYGLPLPVVGGEKAIREPWRMAVAVLYSLKKGSPELAERLWPDKIQQIAILHQLLDQNIQVIMSSGAGRIFDAVAALLQLCDVISYEGEAAIRLANCAERYFAAHRQLESSRQEQVYWLAEAIYPTGRLQSEQGAQIIDWSPMFEAIVEDIQAGVEQMEIAYRFHVTLAQVIIDQALALVRNHGVRQVVLSGGTWHNELLCKIVTQELRAQGIYVYSHSKVPTNDGGIALGQAVIAMAQMDKDRQDQIL